MKIRVGAMCLLVGSCVHNILQTRRDIRISLSEIDCAQRCKMAQSFANALVN